MSSAYGQSFAEKFIQDGKYEEALAAADKALVLDEDDEGAHADRGAAAYYLKQYAESVASYERAIALGAAKGLEGELIDDAYYESVRALAVDTHERGDSSAAERVLADYSEKLPAGRHKGDRAKWVQIFRGQAPRVVQR
jgi:tetratricopeptide (TPR) repeat protein